MSTAIAPDTGALQERVTPALEAAKQLTISDSQALERAVDLLQGVKLLRHEVDQAFDDLIAQAHQHHKNLIERKRKFDGPLADAEVMLKRKAGAFVEAQERARLEEQRRLEAEERRKADEAAAAASKAEEDRRLAEAEAFERDGLPELADEIVSAPVPAPLPAPTRPVVLPPALPKVAGVSFPERWSAVVTDKLALIKAVADGDEPMAYLDPNMPALNNIAKSQKGEMRIPGVEARSNRTPSVRPK